MFNEIIIIGGIFFREFYEHKIFKINQQKYEKIYLKRDRYRALLQFVYNGGKFTTGDKVISGLDLKALISEKTNIPNSNKFVDDFFRDMTNMEIFVTNGKRREIGKTFDEAMNIVEHFDDTLRILENLS